MNLNTKIIRMAKSKKISGDVGIEIECETKKQLNADRYVSDYWRLHSDGSLRGYGYEFVLHRPIEVKETEKALKEWQNFVKEHNVQFVDSKRASVHVHVNVQEKRIFEVINILCAYWLVEPLLLNIAGDERKGNLFCLGINCADTVHTQLVHNLKQGSFFQRFSRDSYRYASVNLEALYKFGSLEFRTLRGTQDISLIQTWTTELHALVENASKFKSPHDMVEIISQGKHKRFLCTLFSESFVDRLIKESGYRWRDLINENLPLVLDILAAKDEWDPKKDEANEKKALEQLKAQGLTHPDQRPDHYYDNNWWPRRGAHGAPFIGGMEIGIVMRRRNDDMQNVWRIWDGNHWADIDEGTVQRHSVASAGGQRFIPDWTIHPRVVEVRREQMGLPPEDLDFPMPDFNAPMATAEVTPVQEGQPMPDPVAQVREDFVGLLTPRPRPATNPDIVFRNILNVRPTWNIIDDDPTPNTTN